jgi:hypothetical protein
LICDGFGTHETLEILEFCFENNIILYRLPSYISYKLQPCNVGVFAPLKAAYRDQVERLLRGGISTVGKEHFTSLYSPIRERAFTKRNITASWAASGLFPFNLDRVLRHIPKPPAQLTAPEAAGMHVGICPQDDVLQTSVTSVSAEALTSLHNIIKQEAQTHNGPSVQRLQRHVQKLANAAQISFADCALLRDQNQFLRRINNEAKVRRSTRSVVLGKAKVMSFEDIEEARAKRAAKEVIKGKGQRGWKRKSAALEAVEPESDLELELDPQPEPEPETEVARAAKEVINDRRKRGRKRQSAALEAVEPEPEPEPEPEVARMIEPPEPWRAPVARMI